MARKTTPNMRKADSNGDVYSVATLYRDGAHIPQIATTASTITGPSAQSAINTNLLTGNLSDWVDVSNFSSGLVHIIATSGISAGAIIFEGTNDITAATFPVLPVVELTGTAALISAAATIAASASRAFVFPLYYKYMRVRISTGFTGGTIRAVAHLKDQPFDAVSYSAIGTSTVSVSGSATVAYANTTLYTLNAAATTNAASVKASAGTMWGMSISNIGAAARYVKLYNKASAPTVGTDVPVLTIPVAAGTRVDLVLSAQGRRFSTGIAIAVTTDAADSDTTAVSAANEVKINIDYT